MRCGRHCLFVFILTLFIDHQNLTINLISAFHVNRTITISSKLLAMFLLSWLMTALGDRRLGEMVSLGTKTLF
jgi:hypothetical protein